MVSMEKGQWEGDGVGSYKLMYPHPMVVAM